MSNTNNWILTDDDAQQYVHKVYNEDGEDDIDHEDEFDLIEMSLVNPETNDFIVYYSRINVMDILEQERPAILEILRSYGYGDETEAGEELEHSFINDEVEDAPINAVIERYGEDAPQIIAECYFEYYGTLLADEILFFGEEEKSVGFIQNWIKQH